MARSIYFHGSQIYENGTTEVYLYGLQLNQTQSIEAADDIEPEHLSASTQIYGPTVLDMPTILPNITEAGTSIYEVVMDVGGSAHFKRWGGIRHSAVSRGVRRW